MWPLSRRSTFGWPEAVATVVVLLLGTLLLLPSLKNIHEGDSRIRCKNNLAQLGKATASYQSLHNSFPPGVICSEMTGQQ
jgi:hypothetical protein